MKKKVLAIILSVVFIIVLPIVLVFVNMPNGYVEQSSEADENYNEEYYNNDEQEYTENEPLHQTEVPEGYIGIYSIEDFDYIPSNPQYNYILMKDLDVTGINTPEEGYDIDGVFDGNNYTISNYSSNHPLFESPRAILNLKMENATITNSANNLNVDGYAEDDYVSGSKYTAILAQHLYDYDKDEDKYEMENCHVSGVIKIELADYDLNYGESFYSNVHIGGLVASALSNTAISNCSFDGKIEIISSNKEHTYSLNVGGICGKAYANSLIFKCNTYGNIDIDTSNNGFNIGGICGKESNGSIQYCGNNSNINSKAAGNYGGIIGYSDWHGANIYNSYNDGNISNLLNDSGPVTSALTVSGGIAGEIRGSIVDCYNTGNMDGAYASGGIIGVSATTVKNVYNTGVITCKKYKTHKEKQEIYHKGGIAGMAYIGGESYGVLENCYYTNDDINAVSDNSKFPYVKHLTEIEAKTQNSFSGFDFESDWKMDDTNNKYPSLIGVEGQ